MSAGESVVASIQHYQKSIQKYHGNSSRIRHCIEKLYKLPVTVKHLQETGIGKTVNSLRKSDGEVGEAARALVAKWKQMVEEEDENEQGNHSTGKDVHAHNDDSGMERLRHNKDKSDSQAKTLSEESSRNENLRGDYGKNHKRKKECEYDDHKEKRRKSEETDGSRNYHSISGSDMKRGTNGKTEDPCSDEDWQVDDEYHNRGLNSDEDRDTRSYQDKMGRDSSEECFVPSSGDDLDKGEYLPTSSEKESWHRKTNEENNQHHEKLSKKEKHSSHKSKSSSSSSGKTKHSSSNRNEDKESKSSSSSKHKVDKGSSSGTSSSSKKTGSEEKLKIKEKDKKEKHKEKHRTKEEKKSKDKKKEKEKKKAEPDEDGVDSFSGKSFGEALGMMFAPDKSRKKSSQGSLLLSSPSTSKCTKSYSSLSDKKVPTKNYINSPSELERECASLPLEPSLEVDEDFGLPALNPNYKPLPQPSFYNSPPKRYQTDDDDLTNIMYSKVQRTKVFSGNRSGYTSVPSLFDLCTRVLQENIDALEYTGGVPFEILKPVLERATPDQLFTLEDYNAYLIEDTDILWEFHCKKDFRNKKREELETWREMYLRCREERENKLKSLTANIAAASKAKALPVRKTQLAYIEGTVKPPRNIARKQAKFGTAHASSSALPPRESSGSSGLSSSFTGRSSTSVPSTPAVSVPTPRGASGSLQSSSCKPKPKAPLMQKALQLIKYNRFKR